MINLTKGGRINLSKESNGLTKLFFGSNWGMIEKKGLFGIGGYKEAVDLDSSVLLYNSNKECIGEVSYRHLDAAGIHHSGDDRVGDAEGDDGLDNETISVELDKIHSSIEYLVFVLNNFTHQKFNKIPYMGMRIYTGDSVQTNINISVNTLAEYKLTDKSEFNNKEAVILGIAYKKDGDWRFKAVGEFGGWYSIDELKRVAQTYLTSNF